MKVKCTGNIWKLYINKLNVTLLFFLVVLIMIHEFNKVYPVASLNSFEIMIDYFRLIP